MCEHEWCEADEELHAAAPGDQGHQHGPGLSAVLHEHPLTRRRVLQAAVVAAATSAVAPFVDWLRPTSAQAATGWRYFRTDPHVHCVVSGDAVADPGILAAAASTSGQNPYDVLFLTDHHLGSKFLIKGQGSISGSWGGALNGGTEDVQDSASKWSAAKFGTLTTYTAAVSTTQVKTVSPALRLVAQAPSGSYGEAMGWYKRGPNLLSTSPTITFSVYPTQVAAGCSIYVSAAIGGDPTTPHKSDGYTRKS